MSTAIEITTHHEAKEGENPWVHGPPPPEEIHVVTYNANWPATFERLAADIQNALGAKALRIDHVGSTSVPGLAAKPVIDIDLTVSDPVEEALYVPALEAIGYDLIIREPSWHQHRCLRLKSPRVNLHIFGPECPENIRHLLFRDWLREHPEDRELYADAKKESVVGVTDVMAYNRRKQDVIRDIYARVFRAAGLI